MQSGTVVKISGRWYVRYWERRNVNGSVEQKRVSHLLGPVTTRGKHPPADIEDAALIERAKQSGKPVVTVLLSGRPLILGEALSDSDAFLAAWLPGTEGQGVADVLFGDYQPTGKLPVTWPRSMDQVPIHSDGGRDEMPLFPYGFGLSY